MSISPISDVDFDLWDRSEVAKAAKRIPKIAPRVPPMSSTAPMMACSTVKTDPEFAVPSSRILSIAIVELGPALVRVDQFTYLH